MTDHRVRWIRSEADTGTFGTSPFSNDGAFDLIDEPAAQTANQRRENLERIFFRVLDHPDLLGWKFFPDQVVTPAAVVPARLPGGESLRQDLADLGHDSDALMTRAPDPESKCLPLRSKRY